MAIISYNAAPAKGQTRTGTLSKATVLALAPVAADAYWADGNNTQVVVVVIKSTTGKQKRTLTFDFTVASPTAELTFPQNCRNSFAIEKITMIDYLGDKLKIAASAVDLSADDITLA